MDQMTQTILMLVVMLALMYFLMIRPENKRKKQAEEMRSSLKKGDTITTIGGIVGKIVRVGDETIVVETSEDRVRIEFAKWAVSTNANAAAPAAKKAKEEPAIGSVELGGEVAETTESTETVEETQE